MKEEFYIGWQASTPKGITRAIKIAVITLCAIVPIFVILTVTFQRKFSSGTYETTPTELEGFIVTQPVSMLVVPSLGQSFLLVSPGKFGAEKSIVEIEQRTGQSLVGAFVKAKGNLIWYDGTTLLELQDAHILPPPNKPLDNQPINLGNITLRGEITDPKCLLGTMNPGEGIPHRGCAVRCIAGGITPVLKVANTEKETAYYLMTGPNGIPVNHFLLPHVGFGVQVCGNLKQYGEWLVLEIDTTQIKQLQLLSLNPGSMCH